MQKLPKSIETRINEINSMLPAINELSDFAYTYAGGTWPYYVNIDPIAINGLKVTIKAKDQKARFNYIDKQTYKATDTDYFSDKGIIALKADLGIILKAFKKALN